MWIKCFWSYCIWLNCGSIATSKEEAGRRKKNKEPPDVQKDSPVNLVGEVAAFAAMNWKEETYRTKPDNDDGDEDNDDDDDYDYDDDDRLY